MPPTCPVYILQRQTLTRPPRTVRAALGAIRATRAITLCALVMAIALGGCVRGPVFVPAVQRRIIDRSLIDYPGHGVLEVVAEQLTGPIDCEVDVAGNLIVAESGEGGYEPRIFGYRPDGSIFS